MLEGFCAKREVGLHNMSLYGLKGTSDWKINSTRVIHKVAQTTGLSLIEIGDKMRIQDENSTIEIKRDQISFVIEIGPQRSFIPSFGFVFGFWWGVILDPLLKKIANLRVQRCYLLFCSWTDALRITLHLYCQKYLSPKHKQIQYDYHIIFDFISSLVETMVVTSILVQCILPKLPTPSLLFILFMYSSLNQALSK
jgi:hypothetical protein